jgi:hypothetical protein
MKKMLSTMATVVVAILIAVSSFGVAAAQDEPEGEQSERLVRVLAVDVPDAAGAGEPATITVTDRQSGTAVEGASVYALGWPLRRSADSAETDAARPFARFYLSLGETDGNGTVTHTFERAGKFLIVATADGYFPGLARLTVKPDLMGRLTIETLGRAELDQPVTINVSEKGSGDGVSGADVWAVKMPVRRAGWDDIGSITDLKSRLGEAKEATAEAMLARHGEHLGQSDGNGDLVYAFDEGGAFLLVATKDSYAPGMGKIVVVAKALSIKAPWRVVVGGNVTITATTRGTDVPVEGVDLYYVSPGTGSAVATLLPRVDEEADSLTGIVENIGELLGTTNDAGELEYQFSERGLYLIVGLKDGYIPGFATIYVGEFLGARRLLPKTGGLERQFRPFDGLERLLPGDGGWDDFGRKLDGLRERIREHDFGG